MILELFRLRKTRKDMAVGNEVPGYLVDLPGESFATWWTGRENMVRTRPYINMERLAAC